MKSRQECIRDIPMSSASRIFGRTSAIRAMSYSIAMGSSSRGGIEMMLVRLVALSLLATIANAQGAIRVVQKDGIWWFQDSSGRQFFSLGVNCVGGCYGHAEETPINPSRKARIISTLKDWGFNTVGSWSSPSLWDDLYVADRIYMDFSEITHDV